MALRHQLGALGDAAAEFASSLMPMSAADSAALTVASEPAHHAATGSSAEGNAHAQAYAPAHFQHRRHLSQQEHTAIMHQQQQHSTHMDSLQLEQQHMMQNRASGLTALDAFTSVAPELPQASARPPTVRKRSASASVALSSNPKSDAQKDRVSMACMHCRSRKVRCDGEQPACGLCTRLGRPCNYNRVSEAENLLLRARKRALKVKRAGEKKAAASGAQDMADDADETMTDAPGGSQDAAQQPSSARRRSRVSTAGPHSSSATDTLSGSRSRSTSVSESISPAMTSVDNFAAGVMMPWQSSSMQLTSAPGSPTAMDMSMPALPTWLSKPAFGDVAPHGTVAPHATMSAQNANTTAWAGQQQQQMQQYSYGTQGAFGGGGTASRPPPVPYAVGGSSLNAARGSADMMTGSWRSAGSWGSCPYGSSDGSDSAPSSLVQRRAATRAAGGQSAGQEVQLHMSSQPHAQPSNLASTSHGLGLGDASMQYTQGGSASTGSNTSAERHNPYDLRLPAAVVQNAAEQWRQSMGYPKTENPASSDVAAGPHGDSNAEHNLSNEALRSQRFGNFTLQQPANMQPQTSQQDQGAGDHVLDMPKLTHQGAGGWAAALASTGNSSLLADPLAAARAATAGSIQWTPDESGPQGFPHHLFDQHSQGQ